MKHLIACFILLYSPFLFADNLLTPSPPPIQATAYILQDFHSQQAIMAKAIDDRVEPASLTKLMTAYLVFKYLHKGEIKLQDTVRISEAAWRMVGSRMYLEVDKRVTVEDLIQGMIVQSGNDASLALAEYVAGSEETFVTLMNQEAKRLGLDNTQYRNSTGLTADGHYSSARDLAAMARALITDFPEYYRWYSQKEFTYNGITQQNRNLLLWRDDTVDGFKTGYTEKAGYCLISSARRGQMRMIAVVLGAESAKARASESQKMLDYGFRFFETYQLYQARQALATQRVWQGAIQQATFGANEPLFITIPKGQYQYLNIEKNLQTPLIAPLTAGQTYGSLQIRLANRVLVDQPLVALQNVPVGSWWQQANDYLWLQFE